VGRQRLEHALPQALSRGLVRYQQEYCLTKSGLKPTTEIQVDTPTWLIAVRAAEAKQATDIKVLDLTGITSFADYFVICGPRTGRGRQ
jgi:hypothetical protein